MFGRHSRDHLEERLEANHSKIAAHPLSSPDVKAAQEVVEKEPEVGRDAVELELKQRGLPSLMELGRIQLKQTLSWGRLHRERKKLLAKIGRL